MSEIVSFSSGGVPGGILLLLFLLFTVNLSLQFFASSKLVDVKLTRRRQLTYSAVVLLVYIVLWAQFRPPLPRERIVILPTVARNGRINMDAVSFRLPEYIQRYALNNLTGRYIMHHWQWLLEAMYADSLPYPEAWRSLAGKLKTRIIVESRKAENNLQYRFYDT